MKHSFDIYPGYKIAAGIEFDCLINIVTYIIDQLNFSKLTLFQPKNTYVHTTNDWDNHLAYIVWFFLGTAIIWTNGGL